MKENKLSYKFLKLIGVCKEGLNFWLNKFGKEKYTISQALKKIKKNRI